MLVSCQLNATAYFPGDFLYLLVKARTPPASERHIGLFWLTAHVHGFCRVDPKWVRLPDALPATPLLTALGYAGSFATILLESSPTVVGCESNPAPDTEFTYLYYVHLPHELVPSFIGSTVKFSYMISLSVQVNNAETRVIKVPFRVIGRSRVDAIDLEKPPMEPLKLGKAHGQLRQLHHPDDVFGFVELRDHVSLGRVDLARAEEDYGYVEWALLLPPHHCPLAKGMDFARSEAEDRAAGFFAKAHRHGRVYGIRSKEHALVEWRTKHSVTYLDDPNVSGVLDFRGAQVQCHRVHIALIQRETIRDPAMRVNPQVSFVDKVIDEVDRTTLNALQIPVFLEKPLGVSQTFSTKVASVRCLVRFVFWCERSPFDDSVDIPVYDAARPPIPLESLDRIEWELDIPIVVSEMPMMLREEPQLRSLSV